MPVLARIQGLDVIHDRGVVGNSHMGGAYSANSLCKYEGLPAILMVSSQLCFSQGM